MFFEVTAISKDSQRFTAKFICENKSLAGVAMNALILEKGWEQYLYKIQDIKKLSTETMDEHLRKEEDMQ